MCAIPEFRKGGIMLREKTRRFEVCVSTVLTALVGAFLLLPVSTLRANSGADSAASSAMFRTKCAICHGQDGAGSAAGKSVKAPGLRLPVFPKLSRAGLAQNNFKGNGGGAFISEFLTGEAGYGLTA